MSFRKKLAAWLDPEADIARAESKAALLNAQDAINEMTSKIEELSRAHDNTINAATKAGITANARGEAVKRLTVALRVGRSYILDTLDDIQAEYDRMGERSKKKPEIAAMLAAVQADRATVEDALDSTRGLV